MDGMTAEPHDFWTVFSTLAATVGDVEAILAPGQPPLRFAALPARIEAIRAALNGAGIGRGDRVVVVVPRGPEMAVCYLGIAACATFVPLNPGYTEDEFQEYLDRIHPRAIVVQKGESAAVRSAAAKFDLTTLDLVPIETSPAGTFVLECSRTATAAHPEWASSDDIAAILLTSGSTARPKLVPLKHRHLLSYAHAMKRALGLAATDRYLHLWPMFHSAGLKRSLAAPLAAGSGVICPRVVDVPSILAALRTFRPTWYSAAYPIQHAILEEIDRHPEVARGTNLRFICLGAGAPESKILRRLEDAFGVPALQDYAMTETGNLTYNPLPPRVRKHDTAGVTMFNDVRIMNESGEFLGPYEAGEVVVRGPGVFDGYLDDPEGNAAAFVDGWFRTGDLGSFDAEGYLTLRGRIKELISRGGEKIGALEVERVLAEHPTVGQVCVFGIPHPTLGEEVMAAVVPAPSGKASEEAILSFARRRLAPFKVPRRILFLPALPVGATGKIDRRAVAVFTEASMTAAAEATARRTASGLEREVETLWQRVLNRGPVGPEEDFFLAGGDSLKAAQLFAEIADRFEVTLALQRIFDSGATVAGQARLIEQARGHGGATTRLARGVVPLKTDGDRLPLFAVPADGDATCFLNLARFIDARQPVYGLQAAGLAGEGPPLERIEDIAAEHLGRMRTVQPAGPYHLAGVCAGGLIAYEMARQLEASGERVGLLLLLDPAAPFTTHDGRPRGTRRARSPLWRRTLLVRLVLRRLGMHTRAVLRRKGNDRLEYVREKLRILSQIARQRDLFRGDRREFHEEAVKEAHRVAGRRYVPGPYHGPTVVLLTTSGRPVGDLADPRLDWLKVVPQAGGAEYVPGADSGDMLIPPQVGMLAERINISLAAVAPSVSPQRQPSAAASSAVVTDVRFGPP